MIGGSPFFWGGCGWSTGILTWKLFVIVFTVKVLVGDIPYVDGSVMGGRAIGLGVVRADSIRKYFFVESRLAYRSIGKKVTHICNCLRGLEGACKGGLLLVSKKSVLRNDPVMCCDGFVSPTGGSLTTRIVGCVKCSMTAVKGRSVRVKRRICSQ